MARRKQRRLAGFLGGAAEGAGDMLGLMATQALLMQRQEALQKLIADRQTDASTQNFWEQLALKAASDPKLARRLSRHGMSELGGVPTAAFLPSDEEMAAPMLEELFKASSPAQLPSGPEEIIARLSALGANTDPVLSERFRPSVEGELPSRVFEPTVPPIVRSAMGVSDARRGALLAEDTRQTALGGERAQLNARSQALGTNEAANITHPDEIRRTIELEDQTRPSKMTTAEQEAQIAARYADRSQVFEGQDTQGPGYFVIDERTGQARRVPNVAPIPDAADTRGRTNSAAILLARFKELSEGEINTESGFPQWVIGAGRGVKQFFNLDDAAQEFKRIREPLGALLAVIAQGSRPSDIDVRISTDILPTLQSPKNVARNLIANAERIVIESGADRYGSIEELVAAIDRGEFKPIGMERLTQEMMRGVGNAPGPVRAPIRLVDPQTREPIR